MAPKDSLHLEIQTVTEQQRHLLVSESLMSNLKPASCRNPVDSGLNGTPVSAPGLQRLPNFPKVKPG